MARRLTRRNLLMTGVAAGLCPRAGRAIAQGAFRFGLTPVFLDNDAVIIDRLGATLSAAMDRPIELVQRRTYQEITGLLLEGSIDAAWLCGYPFLRHAASLSLIAAPVWDGRPLYRSYLITRPDDDARGLSDLEGGVHAFSDPDSNSGWLVTASDLAGMDRTPEAFFRRTFFTYGHRNVVRAVGSGLARSGSVDGYVWDVLATAEPELAGRTRVIARSEWLGFPPVVARADLAGGPDLRRFGEALLDMSATRRGRDTLALLHLDGFRTVAPALYAGIAARMRTLGEAP